MFLKHDAKCADACFVEVNDDLIRGFRVVVQRVGSRKEKFPWPDGTRDVRNRPYGQSFYDTVKSRSARQEAGSCQGRHLEDLTKCPYLLECVCFSGQFHPPHIPWPSGPTTQMLDRGAYRGRAVDRCSMMVQASTQEAAMHKVRPGLSRTATNRPRNDRGRLECIEQIVGFRTEADRASRSAVILGISS